MQLSADNNMQVVQPTSASQIFHVLRRQMVRMFRKPLIIMTPKSLLRAKDASSPLTDFTKGEFKTVIGEQSAEVNVDASSALIACSGKVYYDLVRTRADRKNADVAIVRVEQLYPFPHKAFAAELKKYPNATEVVWCQDEPQNQGAWFFVQHYIHENMNEGQRLGYAGRRAVVVAGGRLRASAPGAAEGLARAGLRQAQGLRADQVNGAQRKNNKANEMSLIEVKVPQLSESVAEATLLQWKKKPGPGGRAGRDPGRDRDRQGRPRGAGAGGGRAGPDHQERRRQLHRRRGDRQDRHRGPGSGRRARCRSRASRRPSRHRARSPAFRPRSRRSPRARAQSAMPAAAKLMAEHDVAGRRRCTGTGKDGRVTKGDVLEALRAHPPAAPRRRRRSRRAPPRRRRRAGARAARRDAPRGRCRRCRAESAQLRRPPRAARADEPAARAHRRAAAAVAIDQRHPDHVQRSEHGAGDRDEEALPGEVREGARRQDRLHELLRQGRGRGAEALSDHQRLGRRQRHRLPRLLRHRHRRRLAARPGRADPAQRRPDELRRHREEDRRVRQEGRATASSRSTT